ncbi:MAG: PEP-CTERM sorting domain-containing protein [Isosphaeraceae bacterium]|jgi:hypothetical protein
MTSRMRCAPALALLVAASLASPARADSIKILNVVDSNGYVFTNFDGPVPSNTAMTGTNSNGISNTGTVVGFSTPDGATFTNFTANPLTSTVANPLNINGSTAAMAFGVNSAGTVVGTDGNGNAFSLSNGTVNTFIPLGGTSAMAFGINDHGLIVGQSMISSQLVPGFIKNGSSYTTINAPTGSTSNVVNAQGINNNGLVVGFYQGNDGQVHGFMANSAVSGTLTGTPIKDPVIPVVPGEPVGTTFVFSQILGINDQNTAVGYYGDSTLSQHGYFYNTNTGTYTFLDDPNAAFNNGVEVTQITGINNSGEITGFYSDANGVFHGFVAVAVPEPSSMALLGIGVTSVVVWAARKRRKTTAPSLS